MDVEEARLWLARDRQVFLSEDPELNMALHASGTYTLRVPRPTAHCAVPFLGTGDKGSWTLEDDATLLLHSSSRSTRQAPCFELYLATDAEVDWMWLYPRNAAGRSLADRVYVRP